MSLLEDLDFADDVALVSPTRHQLQRKTSKPLASYQTTGLEHLKEEQDNAAYGYTINSGIGEGRFGRSTYREVTIEKRKQLETTRVTPSCKAIIVLRLYVSGPKLMVVSIVILNEAKHKTFYVRGFYRAGHCVFSLCYFNAFHCRQRPCLAQAPTQPHCSYQSPTRRRSH